MTKLESFITVKKLSIRKIHIEPRKIKAEYCVEKFSGETSSMELIYSYDMPRFKKKLSKDVNLASMILAQVALNYGIFCETIEFDGLYDVTDQKFLINMMENTSREILVNKLLIKNEFIKNPWNELVHEKKSKYTQANIKFVNNDFSEMKLEKCSEENNMNAYAILSSGGKDSLLTYGILKEIGEVHPVYINESGRHWFTAFNAYRHFKENEPNTSKPWCNCDRIYNWMLKQFPFIREDYATIRADIYPIRLWTVAVFLFGALPVARDSKAYNILIGDEYDTTVTEISHGMKHYSGLFDQSKYFDKTMTDYYGAKGWHFRQYSILRSMSELLIMKMLVKRYPHLQKHQVSCHAAHKVEERMEPCGKCEKCRRIIGMLKSLDENPEHCGYNKKQIEFGLEELENKSVKQIGSDAAHLYYLLLKKELIKSTPLTKKLAKEHGEITKLRFDKERSSIEDIPEHVRKPVFDLLIKYADGAVKKINNKWVDFEINEEL